MKISEIFRSSTEVIISKIGAGPYLYYDTSGEIIIECSLERLLNLYVKDGQILQDIDIFAYGFKSDENDTRQYINADDLKKRFEEMERNDSYEFLESVEDDGKIMYVPSYCGFNELLYYVESDTDMIVNCKPIKDVIQEEFRKRIEKSDSIRR